MNLNWHIEITFIFFCGRPFIVTINLTFCCSLPNQIFAKQGSHFINKCKHFKCHSLASLNVEKTLTTNQPTHVLCYLMSRVSKYDKKFHQSSFTKNSLISNHSEVSNWFWWMFLFHMIWRSHYFFPVFTSLNEQFSNVLLLMYSC